MTRDEYLRQLEDALSFMDEEARAAALSFYTEMLDDRMEEGMGEEEAVAMLEQPQSIAARLRAENARQEKPRMERKQAEGEYEKCCFTYSADAIRAVNLHASDMPVRVKPCPGDKLTLNYYSCPQDPYTVTLENGVLRLDHAPRGKAIFGHTFSLNISLDAFFSININRGLEIELCVPADSLMDLSVESSNGAISVEGMHALCETFLRTSNGRVTLENTTCKSLDARTSNGRLTLTGVSAKRFLRAKTSNGRMEARNVMSGEEMTLSSSNSRATLDLAAALGPMSVTTTNGAIAVSRLSAPALTLRTSNSGITGTLPGGQADWAIDSGTSNGRNSLPQHQAGAKPLQVHTSNASISLAFEQ